MLNVMTALSTAHAEMGNKLINVASSEAHPPLGNALRKLGRAWHSLADLDQAQSISDCVVVGDTFGYQGMNARSAKEALLHRAGVLEEYQAAVRTTISKRRNIERLKASSNIRPERVDEALEELEEVMVFPRETQVVEVLLQANKYEQVLAQRANGISQNLHRALATHTKTVTDDITAALIEHTRSSVQYERQLLRELESLRGDVNIANQKVAPPKPNGYLKPSIVLPLEDDILPTMRTGATSPPVPRSSSGFPAGAPPATQTVFRPHSAIPQSASAGPSTARSSAAPSSAPISALSQGGRFGDGTQSMFVKPTPSTFGPLVAGPSSSPPQGPLGGTAQTSTPISPLPSHPLTGADPLSTSSAALTNTQRQNLDPLAYLAPVNMSQSMRVQPSRSRLDARVAASKLANMF
jgi:hypothetical protein